MTPRMADQTVPLATMPTQDDQIPPLTTESPSTEKAPKVPYEDDNEKLNSTMQLAWSEVMQEGHYYNSSVDYRHVHVLMLSWDHQFDDLHVQKEVDDLRAVFEETFNYHVIHKRLTKDPNKKTQNQVNAIVATWVHDHDRRNTLLIVYFAGHGRPGNQLGHLEITGAKSLFELKDYQNSVIWNHTESNLLETFADVLQIFDCCYAGSLGDRGDSRAFEYLAACSAKDTTPRPGENSFTRALIWALKELTAGSGPRFTTSHLLRKILEAPDFPKAQKPEFRKRMGSNTRELIMLKPLRRNEESPPAALNPDASVENSEPRHQDILTLKLVFGMRPDVDDIRKLGDGLNNVMRQHQFHVNRIMWGGLVPRRNDMVFHAVSQFKNNARRKSSRGNGVLPCLPAPDKAAAAAALVETSREKAENGVSPKETGEIHEEVQREFEAQSAVRRAQRRDS